MITPDPLATGGLVVTTGETRVAVGGAAAVVVALDVDGLGTGCFISRGCIGTFEDFEVVGVATVFVTDGMVTFVLGATVAATGTSLRATPPTPTGFGLVAPLVFGSSVFRFFAGLFVWKKMQMINLCQARHYVKA